MQNLQEQIDELKREIQTLKAAASIPYEVEQAFRARFDLQRLDDIPVVPAQLENAPINSIESPTGGVTIDTESRTAINTVITRLESLGLINPN